MTAAFDAVQDMAKKCEVHNRLGASLVSVHRVVEGRARRTVRMLPP